MNPNKIPTSSPEEPETSNDSKTSSRWSILEKMADKYDAGERGRINQMKDNLKQDSFSETSSYRYEQINAPPSTLRKIGRLALDRLGIHFASSENRRRREAMAVAVKEYDTEQEQEILEHQRHLEEQEIERKRQEAERRRREAERKSAEEKEALKKDLIEGMEQYRNAKHERFQTQREQEETEKYLNHQLLTVDALEEGIISEDPRISKNIINYEDTDIPLYTLNGFPFFMISHNIGYKSSGTFGSQTGERLRKDPSVWVQNENEVKKEGFLGNNNEDNTFARGNTISTSYFGSNFLDSRHVQPGSLCYGFSHINGNQLLAISAGDGSTPNIVEKNEETLSSVGLEHIKYLEENGAAGYYDEITLRRYSENGEAYKPDYIITENDKITDDMLRHAAFFDIPIVNINRASYEKINQ